MNYSVFVYDSFNPDYVVEVFRTEDENVVKFKSNLLESLGLITSIGVEPEDE